MMWAQRWRTTGTALVLAGAAVLLAACASSPSKSAAGPEKTAITIGAVPATDTAGLYIAQQQGYFTAVGLHVKIVNIVSAEDAIQAQLAGRFDVTLGNYVSYIEADALEHAHLHILAEGSIIESGDQAIVTMPGSRINSLAKLRGARIAVNVLNNIGTILIGTVLAQDGLSLSEVKLVPIPFPEIATALSDHRVDAAWLPEPFLSAAEEQLGVQVIADLNQGGVANMPIVGYAVTQAWVRKNPRTAAAFAEALERGQLVADTDRSVVEKVTQAFLGVPAETSDVMALPQFPLGVDAVRLQRIADAMQQFGMLRHPFNVSQMIG
jgi:NitT/TauT family transport system substrate-binding protein